MPRIIAPATPEFAGYTGIHPVTKGGFGASTEAGIKANLGTIDKTDTSSGGIVQIGEDGVAQGMQDITVIADFTTVFGPEYFEYTSPTKYEITSYTPFKSYSAFIKELPEAEVIIQDEFLFIPSGIELDNITLVVNGRELSLTRVPSGISAPKITIIGFRDTTYDYLQVMSSEYKSEYDRPAGSIQVQVSTTADFTAIIKDQTVTSLEAVDGVLMELPKGTVYYVRVRLSDSDGRWSDWSEASSVNASSLPNNIATPVLTSRGYLDSELVEIASSSTKMLSKEGTTHASSDWQVSSNIGFTALVSTVTASTTALRANTATFTSTAEVFYVRTRQRNSASQVSAWSNVVVMNKNDLFSSIPNIYTGRMVSGTSDAILFTRSTASDYNGDTVAINVNYSGDIYKYAIYKRDGSDWKIIQYIDTIDYDVDPNTTDHGCKFSNDGNYFMVGNAIESNYGAVRVYKLENGQYRFIDKIINPENVQLSYFGANSIISNDGEFLIVGAFRHTSNTGRAYFYKFENGKYVLKQTLSESEVKVQERYGHNFVMSEDKTYLIMNAMQTAVDGGTVYIYKYNGSTWVKLSKITGKSINANIAGFGLAVSGTKDLSKLFISSRRDVTASGNLGSSLHEFTKNGDTWTYNGTITPSIYRSGMEFGAGTVVRKNGNRLYVPYSSLTSDIGSLYIYDRDGSGWKLVEIMESQTPEVGDVFARSTIVTEDEEFLLVNCQAVNNNIPGILIYKRQTEKYQKIVSLENLVTITDNNSAILGRSSAVSDDGKMILVGNQAEAVAGRVKLFEKNASGLWVLTKTFEPLDAASTGIALTPGMNYGYSISATGDFGTIAIGARYRSSNSNSSAVSNDGYRNGGIYVYIKSGSTWTEQVIVPGERSRNYCGHYVAISKNGKVITSNVTIHTNQTIRDKVHAFKIYRLDETTKKFVEDFRYEIPKADIDSGVSGQEIQMGVGLDVSGDGSIVAATSKALNNGRGPTYIFKYTNNVWVLESKIDAVVDDNNNWGWTTGISYNGKYVAIGSNATINPGSTIRGACAIYERVNNVYVFKQLFRATDPGVYGVNIDKCFRWASFSENEKALGFSGYLIKNSANTDSGTVYLHYVLNEVTGLFEFNRKAISETITADGPAFAIQNSKLNPIVFAGSVDTTTDPNPSKLNIVTMS